MEKSVLATVAGAVLAALGYVAKQLADFLTAYVATKRARQAKLLKLHSLLRAGRVIYEVQNDLTRNLEREIRQNHPNELSPELENAGFEELFSHFYPKMKDKEKDLHTIIRGQTINAMRPINLDLSKWLADDDFYKISLGRTGSARIRQRADLGSLLASLEVHLRLWHAKYDSWMMDHPEHALVYLADEERHGPPFPRGLDDLVANLVGAPPSG